MRRTKEFQLTGTTRQSIRHELISSFLDEEPGTGKGENCSFYIYYVDTLSDGKRIMLKRPARLNKGFDFEVHVENTDFGENRYRTMPTHDNVYYDLEEKETSNPAEFVKVRAILKKLYNCEQVNDKQIRNLRFETGYDIEAILKAVKWLFIEQDITYWNWSGRNMLYSSLNEL